MDVSTAPGRGGDGSTAALQVPRGLVHTAARMLAPDGSDPHELSIRTPGEVMRAEEVRRTRFFALLAPLFHLDKQFGAAYRLAPRFEEDAAIPV